MFGRHQFDNAGLAIATLLGSAVGCTLLLVTPPDAFDAVVPLLILLAAGLLAAQPAIARRLGTPVEGHATARRFQLLGVFGASIYGGYFGGGMGIMMLAVFATLPHRLRNEGSTLFALIRSVRGISSKSNDLVVFP